MWHTGLLDLSIWQLIATTLLLTHVTIVSVTVYLHRYSAHRALELHPALKHFFRFWLWLTTAMNTREWTAIHRKHHAKCETPDDPHSPVHKGLATVVRKGAELYMAEAKNEETLRIYGKNCPDDWVERNLYSRFPNLGIVLMLAIDLALFGALGLTVWAVQMIWIPFWAAGVVNGLGHAVGYRNFECRDAATNLVPWGILIGGEELHNNHHTYPNSAKLSVRKWEFDMGWAWIRLFSLLGLALSLSVQNCLSNAMSGIIILLTRPFEDGDFIEAGNVSGTVRDIGLIYTQLCTIDNKDIYVPNSDLSASKIVNYNREPQRRVDLTFGADYTCRPEQVKAALHNAVSLVAGILPEPAPFVRVSGYGESNIDYVVRVWCKTADYWTVYYDLMEAVGAAFDAHGVSMSYPQMNVHVLDTPESAKKD